MISYAQVQRIAAQAGVSAEIIEKDYLIELILFYISRDDYLKNTFVFRGGTALKKIYFSDYRFSEDLDFLVAVQPLVVTTKGSPVRATAGVPLGTAAYPDPQSRGLALNQTSLREIEQRLEPLLNKVNDDYPFKLTAKTSVNSDSIQSFIYYDIISEIKASKQLKVDIWKDDNIPGWQPRRILFTHQDFSREAFQLNAYNLESVVSDKICRILGVDKEARDIYDLWYLLKLDIDIVKVKAELKNKFGSDTHLPNLMDKINAPTYRINWQNRLAHQIANLPDYDITINELTELVKGNLLNL
jgi:predicted nucleotidyltransferase component of viral defense system